jgi:hypothetical protein
MKRNMAKLPVVIAIAIAAPAWGSDQNISATLTMTGFKNPDVLVAFISTDLTDQVRKCTAKTGSSCTAQNGYGSPPKNISNVLCLPNTLSYIITESCQQLLAKGATQDCKGNGLASYCTRYLTNSINVAPGCKWRTKDNKDPVTWSWVLTLRGQGPAVDLDCSNKNYQDPQK